jgi:hypothetical protein
MDLIGRGKNAFDFTCVHENRLASFASSRRRTGRPAPPTPESIGAVMNLYPIGERFFQEFTLRQVLLNAAKNGSGLSAAGTSSGRRARLLQRMSRRGSHL